MKPFICIEEIRIMTDIISSLASHAGISQDMARKGMGAVLEMCKNKLPAEAYSKVSAAIPGADGMIAAAADQPPSASAPQSGGMVDSLTSSIGKIFGGPGGELAGKLSAVGFSAEQLKGFLPPVFEFLKDKVPPDALKKISSMLPN
jgi:uncharacterized protein (DUF2267 family)